jgi:hypothetical protein
MHLNVEETKMDIDARLTKIRAEMAQHVEQVSADAEAQREKVAALQAQLAEAQTALEGYETSFEMLKGTLDQFDAQHGKPSKNAPKKGKAKKVVAKPAAKKGKAKKAAKPAAKKATAKKAAPKAAKKAAKPAAKKATAKKKTTKASNNSAAAEGRRAVARGDRPSIREAMARVMGKKTMNAAEIVDGLKAKGWMPNAKDPRTYCLYTLSDNKETFERVERGRYKVRDGVDFGKAKAASKAKPAAKKTNGKAKAKKSATEVKAGLEELGIKGDGNVEANPFM